jgi:hypothetical protein
VCSARGTPRYQHDGDQNAVDVAMRSSAGPIGMPAYQGYVDGALYACNPSLATLDLVIGREQLLHGIDVPVGEVLRRIRVCSIGTGRNRYYVPGKRTAWGWGQWLLNPIHPMALLDLVADCGADVINGSCLALLTPERYARLNPALPDSVSILDVANDHSVATLHELAFTTDLSKTLEWIDRSGWMGTA